MNENLKELYEISRRNKQRMIDILRSLDIEMEIDGCGCCDSPTVSFTYKGEVILNKEGFCNIPMEDETALD